MSISSGTFTDRPRSGRFRAVRRAERIAAVIAGALACLRFAVLHHLLGHGLGALAQAVEREALRLRGAIEIALADGLLGVAHGLFRALELVGRVATLDAEPVDQALQLVAK